MTELKVIFSVHPPARANILWIKPVGDAFSTYLFREDRWRPIKLLDDNDTYTPDDDSIHEGGDVDPEAIKQEVRKQVEQHDKDVNAVHSTAASEGKEYPDVTIF